MKSVRKQHSGMTQIPTMRVYLVQVSSQNDPGCKSCKALLGNGVVVRIELQTWTYVCFVKWTLPIHRRSIGSQ